MQAAEKVGRAVVVDWNTSWCGPCRVMKPVLTRLASEFQGRVSFVLVDCEKTPANQTLAKEAAVRCTTSFSKS
jgi:thiol-disulfide isomerase/thioredoxin